MVKILNLFITSTLNFLNKQIICSIGQLEKLKKIIISKARTIKQKLINTGYGQWINTNDNKYPQANYGNNV